MANRRPQTVQIVFVDIMITDLNDKTMAFFFLNEMDK